MHLPFADLKDLTSRAVRADAMAGLAVALLSVPQGLAYALIAGLPPVMGLYAAAVPAVVGSLFRSSPYVIAGPTNALSLLIGGAAASLANELGATPAVVATTLALGVGIIQVSAGLLRLGTIVDYISSSVVLGYITGAAALIGVGQLHHITHTKPGSGNIVGKVLGWGAGLDQIHLPTLAVGVGAVVITAGWRRINKKVPPALVAMVIGVGLSFALGLSAMGVPIVADIASVQGSPVVFSFPQLLDLNVIVPIAVAATVLSLVESSAVARSIAQEKGQPVDNSTEFFGQGMANIAAGFFGAYPTSGSLTRSMLNARSGAETRLSGVLAGLFVVIAVVAFGSIIDQTPVAVLAGLVLVVAYRLVEPKRILRTLKAGPGDAAAFVATVIGTWVLRLDQAIYLGVAISIVMFLRRASSLVVAELAVDEHGHLRERDPEEATDHEFHHCTNMRVVHVEGRLFFASAGELRDALIKAAIGVEVIVVRLKRARGLDLTTSDVLTEVSRQLQKQGKTLILVGMRGQVMEQFERSGVAEAVGREHLFPTQVGWFVAMDDAIQHGLCLLHPHDDHEHCPMEDYLARRNEERGVTL